jgi:hypothetical protein
MHPYATSHPLVDVDWRGVPAVSKDTRRVPGRPGFVQRTSREAQVYADVLHPEGVWAPRLLEATPDTIVLERLDAQPLWQLETADVAGRVGAVLRATHDALRASADAPFLLGYDRRFYDRWFRRACVLAPSLDSLRAAHDEATRRLLAEPPLVIHGELYPANVLVRGDDVRFVDWESAGRGPAVVDLAAVTTGWDDSALDSFLQEYGAVDPLALESARFHLAVRWLGWSANWAPPAEHRRDWLAEARKAAA